MTLVQRLAQWTSMQRALGPGRVPGDRTTWGEGSESQEEMVGDGEGQASGVIPWGLLRSGAFTLGEVEAVGELSKGRTLPDVRLKGAVLGDSRVEGEGPGWARKELRGWLPSVEIAAVQLGESGSDGPWSWSQSGVLTVRCRGVQSRGWLKWRGAVEAETWAQAWVRSGSRGLCFKHVELGMPVR